MARFDWRSCLLFSVPMTASIHADRLFGIISLYANRWAGLAASALIIATGVYIFERLMKRWYVQRGVIEITIDDDDGRRQTWFRDLGSDIPEPMQRGDQ